MKDVTEKTDFTFQTTNKINVIIYHKLFYTNILFNHLYIVISGNDQEYVVESALLLKATHIECMYSLTFPNMKEPVITGTQLKEN